MAHCGHPECPVSGSLFSYWRCAAREPARLATVLDDFSRFIVSWKLSATRDLALAAGYPPYGYTQ